MKKRNVGKLELCLLFGSYFKLDWKFPKGVLSFSHVFVQKLVERNPSSNLGGVGNKKWKGDNRPWTIQHELILLLLFFPSSVKTSWQAVTVDRNLHATGQLKK